MHAAMLAESKPLMQEGAVLHTVDDLVRVASTRTLERVTDGIRWPGVCSDEDRRRAEELIVEARRRIPEWVIRGLVQP